MAANSAQARDIAYQVHPQTNLRLHQTEGPLVVERGDGPYVFDDTGRRYLEGMAGLWCASLGFSERRLAEVAYEQMKTLPYYHTFNGRSHPQSIDLAEKLIEIAPVKMSKVPVPVVRIGGQRHRHQAHLVLPQRHRQAEEEEDHRPHEGVPTARRRPP